MTRRQRRATLIGVGVGILGFAVLLVLYALRDSVVFFHTPAELVGKPVPAGKRIRLGGLVAEGSVKRGTETAVDFVITDTSKTIPVTFHGALPVSGPAKRLRFVESFCKVIRRRCTDGRDRG